MIWKRAILIWSVMSSGCHYNPPGEIDIQGHRGCRGLMPENTVEGFIKAIELGVTTLEMDVCVTADSEVVASHEPWMAHEICLTPSGEEIPEAEEKNHNIFRMTYEEVRSYDCGLRKHPRFPHQKKLPACKPSLTAVIDAVERYLKSRKLPPVRYNIEIKSAPEGDMVFHPVPEDFVRIVMNVAVGKKILPHLIIQSFDMRVLQEVHRRYPDVKVSLLVENYHPPDENLKMLGFIPAIYSPYYLQINAETIRVLKQEGIKLIPWTVNDPAAIKNMLHLGVDGIISDYPDRVAAAVTGKKNM